MGDPLRIAIDEIRSLLSERAERVIVGIVGPPGAGKSTFAERLVTGLNATCAVTAYLPMDGFHLSNTQLERLGRRERKGAADTFDTAGYIAALDRVSREAGRTDVYVPDFDRTTDEPVAAGRVVGATAAVVVTEGNYLALSSHGWQPVRALLDRIYYLDCPAAARRARLVERHLLNGRSRDDATHWVDAVDEPNAALIESTRRSCDRTLTSG